MSDPIAIAKARGRPMLTWVGKRPLEYVSPLPARQIETFDPFGDHSDTDAWADWPARYPQGGLLFHGDNKEVLTHLLESGFRGKVKLIYIDPPFDSGADYVRRVQLRGRSATIKLDGADYTLGEQIQYSDLWANDAYLQFMYERLLLLRELLAEDGSIYVHCDHHKAHHLRCLLDEIFGPERLQNEIVWFYPRGGDSERRFNRKHDTILFYAKGDTWTFNYDDVLTPYTPEQLTRFNQEDEEGRFYWNVNPRGERVKTRLRKEGIGAYDVWTIGIDASQIGEVGYPTLKPEALLERIIRASSHPGDMVLDCFIGGGTTAVVAQQLGRHWIGCDINQSAIQTTARRLRTKIMAQPAAPETQRGFTVWQINDYDLPLPQAELVALACERLGVEYTHADSFFDGTLGRALVKVVPFDHPLAPFDLEEVARELAARPTEARSIVLVCMGCELAATTWVTDWNRMRRAVNRIEVRDIHNHPRDGGIFLHQPATAKVVIRRADNQLQIVIEDFISPTIIQRLDLNQQHIKPHITDWRCMVDCVLIDANYDGAIFNITLADAPARRTDLVRGNYAFSAPPDATTVAINIIDMLGEELLVTAQV